MKSLKETILALIQRAGGEWGIAFKDVDHGECWGYHEHLPFIAESVIKIPIMAAVFKRAQKQWFRFSDEIVLRQEDIVGGSGVLQHLSPGIRLPIRDLVTLMIIQSDNTATNLLIDFVGITAIQETMTEIGMSKSEFHRKLVVYPGNAKENLITAADVSRVLASLAKGRIFSSEASRQMISILKKQQVLNGLPAKLPSEEFVEAGLAPEWEMASKSGWDMGRRHDSGVLYVNDRTLAITVLSQDVDPFVALETLGKIGKEIYLYAQS